MTAHLDARGDVRDPSEIRRNEVVTGSTWQLDPEEAAAFDRWWRRVMRGEEA